MTSVLHYSVSERRALRVAPVGQMDDPDPRTATDLPSAFTRLPRPLLALLKSRGAWD